MRFTAKTFGGCVDEILNGNVNAVLFSGNNYGLATILADNLSASYNADEKVFLDYQDDTKDNPFIQTLYSNLQGGFFSSKKIVKVYNIGSKKGIAKDLSFLEEQDFKDKLVIFFAEDLQSRCELKTFFEKGKKIASIDLYEDTEDEALFVVKSFFKERGIDIESDAVSVMAKLLHGDRLALLQECEKMVYYRNGEKITPEDVNVAIENEQKGDLMIFVDNLLAGNLVKANEEFDLLAQEDVQMIMLLRFLLKQVQNTWMLKQEMNNGKTWEEIGMRIFWKRKGLVKLAVSKITKQTVDRYLKNILHIEKIAKEYSNEIARSFFCKTFLI